MYNIAQKGNYNIEEMLKHKLNGKSFKSDDEMTNLDK